MKTDIEIAQSVKLKPIQLLAAELGLTEDEIIPYGKHIAKVPLGLLDRLKDRPDGKLILVTASTPPARVPARPPRPSAWVRPLPAWAVGPSSVSASRLWDPAWG